MESLPSSGPRIMILGPLGSGKSYLARRLSADLGLPLIHLDREFWLPGFKTPCTDEWHDKVRELVIGDSWVIDGNFFDTIDCRLNSATILILLQVPWRTYMRRLLTRTLKNIGRVRYDLGQTERISFSHIWNAATYGRRKSSKFAESIEKARLNNISIFFIQNNSDLETLVEVLGASTAIGLSM